MLLLIERARLYFFPLLLLPILAGSPAPVLALGFNALWQYRASGGDNMDTRSEFQQRYTLGVGPGIVLQPTRAISLGTNLSYTRITRDSGQGMTTVELLSPSAFVNVTNDIFLANLSGVVTEYRPDSGRTFTTRSWDASLGSNWQHALWPRLRLNYGEGSQITGDRDPLRNFETEDKRYSLGVDWDLQAAKFFYDYSHSQNDDLAAGNRVNSESHFARAETGGSFWRNRLRISLAQQFQHSNQDFLTLVPSEGLTALSLKGRVLDLVSDAVPPYPEDLDFDLGSSSSPLPLTIGQDQLDQRVHFSVSALSDFSQLDELHLDIDANSLLFGAALQWDLYVWDPSGFRWVPEGRISSTFDAAASRLAIHVGRHDSQIMVVATVPAGERLVITRIDAVTLVSGDARGQQRTHLTNASMRMQITPTLAASTGLVLERTENDFESESGQSESESTRRSVNGNLRWSPSPYVSPSLGFSETRQTQTGAPEEANRNYSLIVSTYPLPTLNVSFGATRINRYSDALKTATSDNFSLSSTARIYPDLTANLNTNYLISDRQQTDGTFTTSEMIATRFTLNARLSPALIADFTGNHRRIESERAPTTSGIDSTASLLYRPSDLLAMRLTGTRKWSGSGSPDSVAFNLDLSLLRTRKTRLNFRYNQGFGRQTSSRYGLDGSWDISRYLTLQGRFDYRSASVDSWNFQAMLALRL